MSDSKGAAIEKLLADSTIEYMTQKGVNVITPSTDPEVRGWAKYLAQKLEAILAQEVKPDKVDRFEVIDETGRAYVKGSIYGSPVSIELSYQDDSRTLKVFVSDRKAGLV